MKLQGMLRSVVSVAIVLSLVACGGREEREQTYLERGKSFLTEKNYEKANIEFRNVLQINPKSAEGWYYHGRTQEGLNKFREAMNAYTQAMDLNPAHTGAKTASARIYLFVGETDKALSLSSEALEKQHDNPDAVVVHAAALYQKGQKEQALIESEKVLAMHPDHGPALGLLTRLYMRENQTDKAEAMLLDAVKTKQNDEEIQNLLVQFYSDIKNYSAAIPHVQRLVGLHPKEPEYRNQLAKLYDLMGNVGDAENTLRDAITELPESLPAKLSLVQFLMQKRDSALAQKQLSEFISNDKNNDELKLVSAQLYLQSGDKNSAEKVYREIIDNEASVQSVAKGRAALVQLLLQDKNKLEQAKSELHALLKDNPAYTDGLLLRASLAISENRANDAIDDLRSVLKDQPKLVPALKMLASAYIASGHPELAQPLLLSALDSTPLDTQLRMQFAQVLQSQKQFDAAVDQLKMVKKIEPNAISADELMIRIYLTQQKYPDAELLAEAMQKQYPELMSGPFFKGLILQAQNKYQESIPYFEKAMEKNPLAIESLASLVRSALAINQADLARKKLNDILEKHPEDMHAKNLLGEVEMSQKQYVRAEALFEVVTQKSPAWSIGWSNLASSQMMNKNLDKAIETYQKGLASSHDERLLVSLALAVQQLKGVDAAIDVYDQYLNQKPDSDTAANNLALLLAEHKSDQPSRDRALKLAKRFEARDQANGLDTLGWVYYCRGDYNAALAVLSRADKLEPNNVTVNYHIASAYFSKGEHKLAQQYLQLAFKLEPALEKNPDVQHMLSAIEKHTPAG